MKHIEGQPSWGNVVEEKATKAYGTAIEIVQKYLSGIYELSEYDKSRLKVFCNAAAADFYEYYDDVVRSDAAGGKVTGEMLFNIQEEALERFFVWLAERDEQVEKWLKNRRTGENLTENDWL